MVPCWLTALPIAHRGLHDQRRPENSMAAFKAAQIAGYAIELDVRLMCDGNIAVFHDPYLERVSSGSGAVEQMDLWQLRRVQLHGGTEGIATLDQVFEQIKAPIYIDIKSQGPAGKFEQRLLSLIRYYKPDVVVASFNPQTLIWFRQNAPDIARGIISYDYRDSTLGFWTRRKLRLMAYNARIKPDFISYELESLPYWRVWQIGLFGRTPVLCWTVKTQADWLKARQLGYNIIFERIRP